MFYFLGPSSKCMPLFDVWLIRPQLPYPSSLGYVGQVANDQLMG